MQAIARQYDHVSDYERVGRFLVRTYRTTGGRINWLQPCWEYMHYYHPGIRNIDLSSIGVWETRGEIVGVVHPENRMGTAYLQIDPECDGLQREMLKHAEEHISTSTDGVRRLRVYINDKDDDLQAVACEMGYVRSSQCHGTLHFVIPASFPPIPLAAGFRLKTLAEENDLRKVVRGLWRGFDHSDEPPGDSIRDREFMQSAPNFRKDLNVVVETPDGDFVSYCGMWYEPVHAVAYVEPVATDPDYRRMGLGRAAVLEAIRRCGRIGAKLAYVGSTQPFYLSLGFQPAYSSTVWEREWK